MFLHSLKQIVRSLWKHKSFSFINLLGLSVGITAVVIICLIAVYEKSFDTFHTGAEDIYRVVVEADRNATERHEATTPYPAAKFLRAEYPGVLATQIHFAEDVNLRIGNAAPVEERNVVFADSLFFSVFDFSGVKNFVVSGDPVRALAAPGKAVLTQSFAKRHFSTENPIGQTIKLDAKLEVEVAAIVKDIPSTTHLPFQMLVSFASFSKEFIGGLSPDNWGFRGDGYCYVRLTDKSTVASVERALKSINQKNGDEERDKRERYYLQPLSNIHFNPVFEASNPGYTISDTYLQMLLLLGAFILLIACVNYVNLSTSLAFTKSKEIGIRKTIGASRWQLLFHYMAETLLVTFAAATIGLFLAYLALPAVNHLLDKEMVITQLVNAGFLAIGVGILLLVSLISGFYPAMILAGFKPIESLKNSLALPGKSSTLLRKGLVVFQFATSIALIICTLVIARQMQYANGKSLGFQKEAVVEVDLPSPDSASIERFRSRLQNGVGIESFSFCLGAPISDNGVGTSLKAPELPEKSDYSVKVIPCDKAYLGTYGLQLIAGRWFLDGEEKTLGSGLVVNETLAQTLGYKNAADVIGKKISIGINEYTPAIIGVAKDFHTSSLHKVIEPVALMPFPYFYYAAGVRIHPASLRTALPQLEAAFKSVYPEAAYSVHFIDDQLAKLYQRETRNYALFKAFSAISIFICCIGLWGLIAFVVVRKTKEIGIRKVLGASVAGIVALLSKDFLRLVIVAMLVASPVAWWAAHHWLEGFAYRINIGWWVFFIAGFFTAAVALLTISFQAIKAALRNPVQSLRSE